MCATTHILVHILEVNLILVQAFHVSQFTEQNPTVLTQPQATPTQLPFLLKEDRNVGRPSRTWVTIQSPTAEHAAPPRRFSLNDLP